MTETWLLAALWLGLALVASLPRSCGLPLYACLGRAGTTLVPVRMMNVHLH